MSDLAGIGILFVGLVGAALGLGMWLDSSMCSSKANAMKLERSWGPLQGCIVKYHGEYIPIEQIGVRTIDQQVRP
jgi:hypothetical protein